MKQRTVEKGEWIWKKGEVPSGCFFVFSGGFQIVDLPNKVRNMSEFSYKGNLVGDFPCLTKGEKCETSCQCTEEGEMYIIDREILNEFFSRNPGIFVQFQDQYIIT